MNILRAFTEEAIRTGDSAKIAQRIEKLKRSRNSLANRKDDLALTITEMLTNTISDVIASPAESQAKEMVDRLIQEIESEINSDSDVPDDSSYDDSAPQSVTVHDATDENGTYLVEIQNERNTLATFSGDGQSDVMANVVDYLIETHDLISEIEPLPYVPGRKKAIINDQPSHPYGDEMAVVRDVGEGYYLDTHMNKNDKKKHLEILAEKCGLSLTFEGNW